MSIIDDVKLQYKLGGIAQKLIFWNIGLYIVSLIFFYSFTQGIFNFPSWVALFSDPENLLYKPWTIITYSFFHAGFLHILFNMMVLNFISSLFLVFFTEKQFLSLYILGAIFSGFVFVISYLIIPSISNYIVPMVGASGAIMTLLAAVATYAPYMEIRLLLIGKVKLWHIALVIVILDLVQSPLGNTGGHIAHLGGAFFGFLYIRLLQAGTDITKGLTRFIDWMSVFFKFPKKNHFRKVYKTYTTVNIAKNNEGKDKSQKQIDEILDKISQSGYDSLTKEEKEFLFKVGKN